MSQPDPVLIVDGQDDYWSVARQPLHCLLFLLPLLVIYEAGVLAWGESSGTVVRNGADHWMRTGLMLAGVDQPWFLPVLVVGLLVLWQMVGRYRWNVSPGALVGMLAESLLFGIALIIVGQLHDLAFRQTALGTPTAAIHLAQAGSLPRAISYVGAGVYEEVLFRLTLLPISYGLFRALVVPRQPAIFLSVLTTSLLFSAAHYVGPAADPFTPFSFTFRLVAGGCFAGLFVLRGFGITVGTHAAYDLLVGIILAAPGSIPN